MQATTDTSSVNTDYAASEKDGRKKMCQFRIQFRSKSSILSRILNERPSNASNGRQ